MFFNKKHLSKTLEMSISIPIYIIAVISFVGWLFFSIFCGIGFSALPLDLVLSYKYRPKIV